MSKENPLSKFIDRFLEGNRSRFALGAVGLTIVISGVFISKSFINVREGMAMVLLRKTGQDLKSGQIIATAPGLKGIQLKMYPEGWHFLTGSRDDIWNLCKKGFKLAVDDAPPEAPSPIMHSSRMMLVDRQGRIRGFYEGTTRKGMDTMRLDLENLMQSEENP